MSVEVALSSTRIATAPAPFAPLRSAAARLLRRGRAWVRLVSRRRRQQREFAQFARLDESVLRDLGLSRSEFASFGAEAGGLAAATRRRTELDVWLSASSRFRIRAIDSSL
jgi:hypothetical protein